MSTTTQPDPTYDPNLSDSERCGEWQNPRALSKGYVCTRGQHGRNERHVAHAPDGRIIAEWPRKAER